MGDKPEDVLSSTVEALKNADVSKIEAGFQVSEVTDETPTVRRGRKVAESMGGRGGEVECQGTGHGRNPFPPPVPFLPLPHFPGRFLDLRITPAHI